MMYLVYDTIVVSLILTLFTTGAYGLYNATDNENDVAGQANPSIVVYWGQNSAGNKYGRSNYEKSLDAVCSDNYDIIIMSFLNVFFTQKSGLPSLNLAFHCTHYFDEYPDVLQCPEIAKQIEKCQKMNKKVMISLGGAAGSYGFSSDAQAREFAGTIWQMLLGGVNNRTIPRPFGNVILDGVDLDIEGGSPTGYGAFVESLRQFMKNDTKKHYYISGVPQCPFPDAYLGPSPNTALAIAGNMFDFLSIQFYNNYCNYNPTNSLYFTQSWNNWVKSLGQKIPKFYIGLLAQEGSNGYVHRSDLAGLFNIVGNSPSFGGAMLWDVSWCQNNIMNGTTYNDYLYKLMSKL